MKLFRKNLLQENFLNLFFEIILKCVREWSQYHHKNKI